LDVLDEFPSLTEEIEVTKPVKHPIQHRFPTTGPSASPNLAPQLYVKVKGEIDKLLHIIKSSSPPWSCALHVVHKKTSLSAFYFAATTCPSIWQSKKTDTALTGSWCFTIEFTGHNFFILHLNTNFPLATAADMGQTIIATPFGPYRCRRTACGISTCSQICQHLTLTMSLAACLSTKHGSLSTQTCS